MTIALARAEGDRSGRALLVVGLLAVALLIVAAISVGVGPAAVPLGSLFTALGDAFSGAVRGGPTPVNEVILFQIRLPRLAMGLAVGALLTVAGAIMQGLFRNPLADPGLIGVSGGSALGAVVAIMLGERLTAALIPALDPTYLIPVLAFGGGLIATTVLYGISTRQGRTSVATMLLAGIAIAALAAAVTGFLIYSSNDRQLRDITFWSLGSLGGATWTKVLSLVPFILAALLVVPFLARGLNAIVLGEAEARHLGLRVQLLKRAAIVLVAAAAGAAVAVSGVIGFVGIIVPHLLRLAIGPDHRFLLPAAALGGAALMVVGDMVARTIVAPAELPIGIVMAAAGAPFFLWMLLRRRRVLDL